MTARASPLDKLLFVLCLAALAAVGAAARGHGHAVGRLTLLPLGFAAMLARSRDPRREVDEQTAFEEAERDRAERRAGAAFDSFADSSRSASSCSPRTARRSTATKRPSVCSAKSRRPGSRSSTSAD